MYQLFYKVDKSMRVAPSKISLDTDYEMGGELKANSRSEAIRKWFQGQDVNEGTVAVPKIGDVLRDPMGGCFIFTPQGIWASVVCDKGS